MNIQGDVIAINRNYIREIQHDRDEYLNFIIHSS